MVNNDGIKFQREREREKSSRVQQLVGTVLCHGEDMGQFPILGDDHQPIKRELHKCPWAHHVWIPSVGWMTTNPESYVTENPQL